MDSLPPPQRAAAPCSPAAALPLNGQGTATPTPMDIAPAAVLLNNSQATGAPAPVEKPPSAAVNGQEEKGASSMESLPPAVVRPPPDRPMEPPCIVERVFREFTYRRVALVRALTTDEKTFSRKCIPGMVSMYLYGHTDGSWEVQSLELPLSLGLPKPKAGVNLARDNMKHQEWLEHIAMHCDAWLIRISFFLAAKLEPSERDRLFTMINNLQTVYEKFVSSDTYRRICKRTILVVDEDDEGCNTEPTFCASCGSRYRANGNWICCDICDRWFHYKCVKITANKAQNIGLYECPECCYDKRGHA